MNQWVSEVYSSHTDEQLVLLARQGHEEALTALLVKYTPLVKARVSAFRVAGLEQEDLVQEGMLGLLGAIRVFDSRQASFSTFARLCVDRMLITAVRASKRQKQIPQNQLVDIGAADDHNLSDKLSSSDMQNPEAIVIAQEEAERFRQKASKSLSQMEYQVLCAYLADSNYEEIARRLEMSAKSVDNALQRIRHKLR